MTVAPGESSAPQVRVSRRTPAQLTSVPVPRKWSGLLLRRHMKAGVVESFDQSRAIKISLHGQGRRPRLRVLGLHAVDRLHRLLDGVVAGAAAVVNSLEGQALDLAFLDPAV